MKKTASVILLVLLTSVIQSQTYFQQGDTNLVQIINRNASLPPDSTDDSPYIKFQRFASFWKPRLYPDYQFSKANNAYANFYKSIGTGSQKSTSASAFGNWTCLGPNYMAPIPPSWKLAIGRLDHVEVDADDATGKTIYACTIGGGIFQTVDGGINWSNFFTDNAFGITQVTDCRLVKDPNPPYKKYLYAAVGGDNIPFNGIWRIEIGTSSWQNVTGNLICSGLFPSQVNNIVNKILIDPTDLNNIYLATTKGVFYTCANYGCGFPTFCGPGGIIWRKESNINSNILGICFDYSDVTYKSIYCSGGNIWYTTNIPSGFNCISSSNNSYNNAFNDHTSLPTGILNTNISVTGNSAYSFINIDTHPSQPNKLYAILKMQGVYYIGSTPYTQWNTNVLIYDKTSTTGFPNNFVALSSANNLQNAVPDDMLNIAVLPSSNQLAFSYDPNGPGSLAFYDLLNDNVTPFFTGHADVHDFCYFNNYLYVANDGGVGKTLINPPFNFVALNGNGLAIERLYGVATKRADDNSALVGFQDMGTWKTNNMYSGNTWGNYDGSDGATPMFTNVGDFFEGVTYRYGINFPTTSHNIGSPCSNWIEAWDRRYKSIDGNEKIYYAGHELSYNSDPANSTFTYFDSNISNCVPSSPPNFDKGWATTSSFQTDMGSNPCTNAFVQDFDVSPDEKTIYVGYYNNSVIFPACTPAAIASFPVLWMTTNGGYTHPNRITAAACTTGCWKPLGTVNSLNLTGPVMAVCLNPSNPSEVWVGASGYTGGNPLSHIIYCSNTSAPTPVWTDFSTGLPDMPVNKILFRKGSNYELYAATDVGVYYRTSTMSSWQRVSANLPYVPVLNLEINDCSDKLYAPTFGRGLWVIGLPPLTNPTGSNVRTLSSNTTWNTNQYVFDNIVIPSGITLSINSTNIYMGTGTSIRVEPGGKLDIQNSTLQSFCVQKMWHGIQVGGNPSQFPIFNSVQQRFMNQGYANIVNSTVRDADVAGVSLGEHDFVTTGFVWGTGGGQVNAISSNFINNYKDFEFWYYPFGSKSVISKCTLQVTGPYKSPLITPDARITAWGVINVQIDGTLFSNTASSTDNLGIRGSGINSIDAFYSVKNNGAIRSRFENLTYGINSIATSSSLYRLKIDNTDFNNCARGTYIKSIDFASVTNSNYNNIPSGSFFPNLPYNQNSNYGLYFDYSSNFLCESNTFNGASLSSNNIGCIVSNSQFNANRIYNCDFTALGLGSGAYDDNYDAVNNVGLKLNCNKYTGNAYDIAILSSFAGNPNTDIDPSQSSWSFLMPGNLSNLVRNLYSAPCAGNKNEYFSDKVSPLLVQHYSHTSESGNGGTFNTAPPVASCKDALINVFPVSGIFHRDNTTCPPTPPVVGCPTCLISLNNQIATSISQLNLEQAPLLAGAASSLIAAINSNISPGSLKTLLLNQSPYLSDEVLKTYINITPPPGIEKQILIANSPLTSPVLTAVNNAGLPNGILNQILAAQTGVNKRTVQEAIVNFIRSDIQYAYSNKARYYMEDTSGTSHDSIKSAVSNPYFSDHDIKLLDFYISAGDYKNASNQIIYIQQKYPALLSYCNFKSLEIDLLKSKMGYFTLNTDPARKADVQKVALDNSNLGSAQAQNILQLATGKRTYEYTLLPPNQNAGNRFSQPNVGEDQKGGTEQVNSNDHNLLAIPNPAKNELSIKYKLPVDQSNGIITITDLTGRIIYKYDVISTGEIISVDANSLNNGIYLYNLQVSGTVIETKKLTIVK